MIDYHRWSILRAAIELIMVISRLIVLVLQHVNLCSGGNRPRSPCHSQRMRARQGQSSRLVKRKRMCKDVVIINAILLISSNIWDFCFKDDQVINSTCCRLRCTGSSMRLRTFCLLVCDLRGSHCLSSLAEREDLRVAQSEHPESASVSFDTFQVYIYRSKSWLIWLETIYIVTGETLTFHFIILISILRCAGLRCHKKSYLHQIWVWYLVGVLVH